MTYFAILLVQNQHIGIDDPVQESWICNFIASIGDALLMIFDWLFFEQYLLASLILPIELNIDLVDKELK